MMARPGGRWWWLACVVVGGVFARQCPGLAESPRVGGDSFFAQGDDSYDAAAGGSKGRGGSMDTNGTCAFGATNPASRHLAMIAARLETAKSAECRRLVVYGAALGNEFLHRRVLPREILRDSNVQRYMLDSRVPFLTRERERVSQSRESGSSPI